MGWDVFISHASEDKATVALPLKAALEKIGISVWIDVDQIKLGDTFRSKIDLGLQQCRFGVIVLSPHFFRKRWAKAELDAFLQMEMSASGTKRLLPVLIDMSFDDLLAHSPLLSGRRAAKWDDGVLNVAQEIAEVVAGGAPSITSASPTPHASSHAPAKLESLVLFFLSDGRIAFIESIDIEHGVDGTHLTVKCSDPTDTALVQDLALARSDLAVAFGTTAMKGHVSEAVLKRSGTQEVGIIKLRNVGTHGGDPMEMSFAGYSADKLAEMRARRILLDEQFAWRKQGSAIDALNQATLDRFVGGYETPFKVTESPFPKLYSAFAGDPNLFLAIARLAAVGALCLSNVVQSVLKLELRLAGKRLHVDFAGRRARKFTNVDPPVITVTGVCDLS